jgi:hypothetical protein
MLAARGLNIERFAFESTLPVVLRDVALTAYTKVKFPEESKAFYLAHAKLISPGTTEVVTAALLKAEKFWTGVPPATSTDLAECEEAYAREA